MNILLADDHAMTLEGYTTILKSSDHVIYTAKTSEEIYAYMAQKKMFDVAVIDVNLPSHSKKDIKAGAECVLFVRHYLKNCKCILMSSRINFISIYAIYKKARPDALIIKEDISAVEFKTIVNTHNETVYLSRTAKQAVAFAKGKASLSSDVNIEILRYLSEGFHVSELREVIGLSKSAIQKRVAKIQVDFNVTNTSDLIKEMYALGHL